MIQNQVHLPFRVALDVVLQGIRIRLGRSLITVFGVVFGIAFLSSILTGQALQQGVAEEDAARLELNRMTNFLASESGPLDRRTVAVHIAGPLNPAEERFLLHLGGRRTGALRWSGDLPPALLSRLRAPARHVPSADLSEDASALVILGNGAADELPWTALLHNARQRVLALSRRGQLRDTPSGWTIVRLEREPDPAEIARMEEEANRVRFRNLWIIIISLLVTVIGIANAMLMSVTERFREIGTMKCLGALSSFIRRLFLIESGLMGIVGGIVGCLLGAVFSVLVYGLTYGFALTGSALGASLGPLLLSLAGSVLAGIVLSILAALYPASVASRMVPAVALRSNV